MGLGFQEVLVKRGGVDSHGARADLSAHIALGQDQIVPQESRRATVRREIFSLGAQTTKPDVKTISNNFVNRTCRKNSSYYYSGYKLGKEAGVDLRGGDASYDDGDERDERADRAPRTKRRKLGRWNAFLAVHAAGRPGGITQDGLSRAYHNLTEEEKATIGATGNLAACDIPDGDGVPKREHLRRARRLQITNSRTRLRDRLVEDFVHRNKIIGASVDYCIAASAIWGDQLANWKRDVRRESEARRFQATIQ